MTINTTAPEFYSFNKSHPAFTIVGKTMMVRRASIQIHDTCPAYMKLAVVEAISNGWIEPIAAMSYREMALSGLLGK
jgi:hypothetical protein